MKVSRIFIPLSGLLLTMSLLWTLPVGAAMFKKKTSPTPPANAVPPLPTNVPPPVAEVPPPVAVVAPPATNAPAPKPVIVWDATLKEVDVKLGETVAKVFFTLTNTSPVEAVVTSVRPSCGCTTAHLPPMPWTNAPGASGQIDLSVNIGGKSGTLFKNVTVDTTAGQTTLQIKVVIPDAGAMRDANMKLAAKDRQAVLKGDCAACHVAPGVGKMGAELYTAVCGVCHEAAHRATMVADLHHLNHPTSREHWHTWISSGKPDTLMPAFAQAQGGTLTPEQIDSLADYLVQAIPSIDSTNAVTSAQMNPPAPAAH